MILHGYSISVTDNITYDAITQKHGTTTPASVISQDAITQTPQETIPPSPAPRSPLPNCLSFMC